MRSMTGYGHKQVVCDSYELTLEIKTVNHRFLDLSFRMPKRCSFLEDILKGEISSKLARGHADVSLTYVNSGSDARCIQVDTLLARQYQEALEKISRELQCGNHADASFFASLPNVLTEVEKDEDQQKLGDLARQAVQGALEDVLSMREREGSALQSDLTEHLDALEAIVRQIEEIAPSVPAAYREKLTARLQEANITGVDPQRLAQEVAIFADKCAVDKELSRLNSHIAQMRSAIASDGEVGKRLDFLTQELNREVNTIGSKAADARITSLVVIGKNEIEKLREQVQNVE